MSSPLNAETQAWRGITVVNQSVDQANRRLSNANQPRSECSNGTAVVARKDPAAWDRSPNRRTLPGLSARRARVLLVPLASDSQLQALSDDDAWWAALDGVGPVLVLGWHLPTQPVGIPRRCRTRSRPPYIHTYIHTYMHAVSWFSPQRPDCSAAEYCAAEYDTLRCSRDTTRPLQPRRWFPRIRISRLPRVSRTTLPWRALAAGRPSRFSNVVRPAADQ